MDQKRMAALRAHMVEGALRLMLDGLENRLEEAEGAYADAQWRGHFGQTREDEMARLEAARASLLLGEQARATLRRWQGRPHDALLARRVTVLMRRCRWAEIESQPQIYQLRSRIAQTILNFRPHIAGKPVTRVERSEILRSHPDRHCRREAWLALGALAHRIEADVRQLLRRRQALARRMGYDSYVSWALDTMDLDRGWVEAFFDELLRLTDAPYQAWLAEMAADLSLPGGLAPWDLAFAAEKGLSLPQAAFPGAGALSAVRAAAEGLGLGEAAAGVQVDMADIPYAALCYGVRPPDDVRVLLSPRDGHVHYDILFHEFGHALHWRCLRPISPVLRWESPAFNEAMACLWERLVSEPEWLIVRARFDPDRAESFRRAWAERKLYQLRLRLAQAAFEYQAYQAVDGDLLGLFRSVFSEHLRVPYNDAPGWSDSPFWASHPMYMQNYVIGEAVASQTLAALRRKFGSLMGKPQVGAWLTTHYYEPGASFPWAQKLFRATGAALATTDLVADLT